MADIEPFDGEVIASAAPHNPESTSFEIFLDKADGAFAWRVQIYTDFYVDADGQTHLVRRDAAFHPLPVNLAGRTALHTAVDGEWFALVCTDGVMVRVKRRANQIVASMDGPIDGRRAWDDF